MSATTSSAAETTPPVYGLPPAVWDAVGPALEGMGTTRREVFCSRLAHWYPDLIDGLTTLYGEKAEGTAAHLAAKAAHAYAERSGGLRRLDLDRTLDPLWAQDPSRIGYAAYTERFAGDLRGVEERIPYLRELGVSYLHLMPLLTPRPGDSDGGYAVAD